MDQSLAGYIASLELDRLEKREIFLAKSNDFKYHLKSIINTKKLFFIHLTKFFPSDGSLKTSGQVVKNKFNLSEHARETIHFTINGGVGSHGGGNWENCPFAVIVNWNDLIDRMVCINEVDSFTFGSVDFKSFKNPNNCVVLVDDIKLRPINVETESDLDGSFELATDGLGYQYRNKRSINGVPVLPLSKLFNDFGVKKVSFSRFSNSVHISAIHMGVNIFLKQMKKVEPSRIGMWEGTVPSSALKDIIINPEEFAEKDFLKKAASIHYKDLISSGKFTLQKFTRAFGKLSNKLTTYHTYTFFSGVEDILNRQKVLFDEGKGYGTYDGRVELLEKLKNIILSLLKNNYVIFDSSDYSIISLPQYYSYDETVKARRKILSKDNTRRISLHKSPESISASERLVSLIDHYVISLRSQKNHLKHEVFEDLGYLDDGQKSLIKVKKSLDKEKRFVELDYSILEHVKGMIDSLNPAAPNKHDDIRRGIFSDIKRISRIERRMYRYGNNLIKKVSESIDYIPEMEKYKSELSYFNNSLLVIINHFCNKKFFDSLSIGDLQKNVLELIKQIQGFEASLKHIEVGIDHYIEIYKGQHNVDYSKELQKVVSIKSFNDNKDLAQRRVS